MDAKLSSFFLIIGILLGGLTTEVFAEEIVSSNPSITFPADPFSFQPGPGQGIANSYCIICHSADYIYMQPPHSQEKWTEIIEKMKNIMGCPIPKDQINTLAQYLFQQNTISPLASTQPQ